MADGLGLFVDLRLQALQALEFDIVRGVIMQVGGWRAGTTRIDERK